MKQLRSGLVSFSKHSERQGEPFVSRASIYKWSTGHPPSRQTALRFIANFLSNLIGSDDYKALASDQKKVVEQILRYCNRDSNQEYRNTAIDYRSDGDIIIRQKQIFPPNEYSAMAEYMEGVYVAYRYKFSPVLPNSIAKEVVKISVEKQKIFVKWWMLIDEKKLDFYDGVVSLVGTSIWMFLHNTSLQGRYRVFAARTGTWGRRNHAFETGLLLSTGPHPDRSVPAVSRVALERQGKPRNLEKFVRQNVRMLDAIDDADGELIPRLIENRIDDSEWTIFANDHLLSET